MKLPEDEHYPEGISNTLVITVSVVTLFVLGLLAIILISNTKENKKLPVQESNVLTETVSEVNSYPDTYDIIGDTSSGLTPDAFDFWEMYPSSQEVIVSAEESVEETQEEPDPSTDGKHIKLQAADGSNEWIMINPYLEKNDYDDLQFKLQSGLMKYYSDGNVVSFVGVDLSKNQEYVDFVKLKKAGIDFVMIRLGARGYESGQLVLDEYFYDNMKRAKDAGLEIGVYFFSQAVSEEEIAQEAEFVLTHLENYEITYPVAFMMEYISNDSCRIENLSKKEKTQLAIDFMDIMKQSGYHTILYGSKQWLLKEIDLTALENYDIWLSSQGDFPEYPYHYNMWQYTKSAEIEGISNSAHLNICFIDYSEK